MRFNYSLIADEYKDDAFNYCYLVLEGKIRASGKVIKACVRHLRDLTRIADEDWAYIYCPEKAQDIISFIEMLPDPKTGKCNELALFQKFILSNLYGWRKKIDLGLRRFKKAMISMARKNGKTILVAGIILYEFLFGKNPAMSRQLFCTANDKKQANIAFDMARKQLDALRAKDKDVAKATKRVRDELRNLVDESFVRVLSRDTGAVDGFEPYVGLLDEYAASKTDEMLELLVSGQTLLKNSLILIISTAGLDLNVPMRATEYPYAEKILDEKIVDDGYFVYVAEQENEKEIEDEESWIKSNPLMEVESQYEVIRDYLRDRRDASLETGGINKVLVKNFNMWRQSSEESYMPAEIWTSAKLKEKPDISKHKVWLGVDVGKSSDLFALSWLVQMEDYWFADSFSFVATKGGLRVKEKRDGISYTDLERLGECEITTLESGVIDDERVFEWIEHFVYENDIKLQGIFYDPYQYDALLTMCEKRHPEWKQVGITQSTMILNAPTKKFRDDVRNGRIKHAGNQLLTVAVNNAYTRVEQNGMRIDKNKNSNKIDPMDALLDAYADCYTVLFDSEGVWTNEKIMNEESMF